MNQVSRWVIKMVTCGHVFEALPMTTHQQQKTHCKNCGCLGYWKFV